MEKVKREENTKSYGSVKFVLRAGRSGVFSFFAVTLLVTITMSVSAVSLTEFDEDFFNVYQF